MDRNLLFSLKKATSVSTVGEVMTSVFWDSSGIIFSKATITATYGTSCTNCLEGNIKAKILTPLKNRILHHHENTNSHSCDS